MAARFWVGGSGTWDATTTTNWSATSGGAGGASAPTSADDVTFNSSSGASPTVTIGTNAVCNNITISAPTSGTLTFAFSTTGVLSFNGNWTNPATLFATTGTGASLGSGGTVYTGSGASTFTSNGYSSPTNLVVNTSTGSLTLASALTKTSASYLYIVSGSFDTAGYTMSLGRFISNANANTQNVFLRNSTVTVSVNITLSGTNLNFAAGTSSITYSGGAQNITVNGPSSLSFYDLSVTSNFGTALLTNINLSFRNLSVSPADNYLGLNFSGGITYTITGTLSATVATSNIVTLMSNSATSPAIINAAATSFTVNNGFVAMFGITAVGAAAPWTATRLGDMGFNSGITFSAARNVYWVGGTGSLLPGSATWALTSGGAGAIINYPKPQDTLIFDANSFSANGQTISVPFGSGVCYLGAVNFSGITKSINFQNDNGSNNLGEFSSSGLIISGDLTLSNLVTFLAGTTNPTSPKPFDFFTRGANCTITSNGVTFIDNVDIETNGSDSVIFGDNYTNVPAAGYIGGGVLKLIAGALDINSKTVTTNVFSSSNSNTRLISFGTGSIALSSSTAATTVLAMATATGFTFTGSGGFTRNQAATATVQFGSTAGGSATNAPNLTVNAGASALTITSGSYFKDLVFTGSTCTVTASSVNICGNLTLATGGTYTATAPVFIASGTITNSGKTISSLNINGAGIIVRCADALTVSGALTLTLGALVLKSSATSTVGSFVTSGTTLKYLQSTTPGTQATISDTAGTNSATYLYIKDSAATGGATWSASGAGNINAGNNTGWTGLPALSGSSNFFFMFN